MQTGCALVDVGAAHARAGPPGIARAQERAIAVGALRIHITVVRVDGALSYICTHYPAARVARIASARKRAIIVRTGGTAIAVVCAE